MANSSTKKSEKTRKTLDICGSKVFLARCAALIPIHSVNIREFKTLHFPSNKYTDRD